MFKIKKEYLVMILVLFAVSLVLLQGCSQNQGAIGGKLSNAQNAQVENNFKPLQQIKYDGEGDIIYQKISANEIMAGSDYEIVDVGNNIVKLIKRGEDGVLFENDPILLNCGCLADDFVEGECTGTCTTKTTRDEGIQQTSCSGSCSGDACFSSSCKFGRVLS